MLTEQELEKIELATLYEFRMALGRQLNQGYYTKENILSAVDDFAAVLRERHRKSAPAEEARHP